MDIDKVMLKKSFVVTIIFGLSTFIQLISNIIVTRLFGAKLELDIFLAAVALPTIIVTVIYGTLNDAFLPVYGEKKINKKNDSDNFFVSSLINITIISSIFSILFFLLSKPISSILYQSRGEEFVNNVSLQMSLMGFSIPFSVIATLFGSYYYSHKHFNRFPLAQLIGSVINLILIIILYKFLGIWALVIAFVVNIIFQIFCVIPKFEMFTKFKPSNILKGNNFLNSWLLLIISAFALRSDTLLIRSFGSHLPSGYLVYLNLISKIFSLATGIMTIGVQIVLLPHLIEYLNEKKYLLVVNSIRKAKIMVLGISVLVVLSIYFLAPFFINLLFVGGKFTLHDAKVASSLLPYFILPAIGWGINGIYIQPLVALKKSGHLAIISCLSLAIGWLVATISNIYLGPILAIEYGLISLFASVIISSEILWQIFQKKLRE